MGGNVSSGQNNDELIDNLIESGLIKSNLVERVFRAVDRGIFYLPRFKTFAYRDLAWREGHIHISAPCIYTRVLESLELRENQSFLNIGSGTGYLSTMVGLILGSNGVNHNIELHADLIDYAREKLGEFVRTSVYFDDFDFCTPRFVQGNFLNLAVSNPDMIFYDRIYVGAGVSDEHEDFIKSLLKIDGILIMPLNDCLMKIRRINENLWEKNSIMTVSYASLITDSVDPSKKFSMPKLKPLTLQEICRFKIRQTIRQEIEKDYVEYYKVKREMSTFNKNRHTTSTTSSSSTKSTKSLRHRHQSNRHRRAFYGVEQFDDDDDDDDEDESDDNDEEEDDEEEDNIYDSDDQFGGDEESGNEQSRATEAATATSTTATTIATQATTTSPSESALARFERILRPRIGLNISYARFDRFDNQLRLLIGHGRVPNSNSNRPSPQQETTPPTPPTTSNPPKSLEQASGGGETVTEAASSKKSISSRLAWLPMVSFRSQEDEPSSSSTSSIVSDSAVRNEVINSSNELSRTNSGIEETRMSQDSRSSEMSDRSRGVRVSESGFSEESSPLSRLSNESVGSCNSKSSNSNPAAAIEAAEATKLMTNAGAAGIANRKRHFSNGYNSETDPSDRDAEKFGSVSSGEEERAIKQLINSSSTTTASATNSDETATAVTEKIVNRIKININTNNNLEESQNMSSSSEYQDHGGGEESSTSPDETFNKIKSNKNDDLMKPVNSKTCGTVLVVGGGNGSGCGSQQRENLLRQRIMQLPLSPHVKSFLLYFRDI